MSPGEKVAAFERIVVPHAKAAFELARWLTRDPHDAEDVVQEAYVRAFRYFDGFHGEDARTWLLAIVRNTFYSWYEKQAVRQSAIPLAAEDAGTGESGLELVSASDPGAELLRASDRELVDRAVQALPLEFREVILLRELHDLSYKQIADLVEIPLGTVMSRISRGREHLRRMLGRGAAEEGGR